MKASSKILILAAVAVVIFGACCHKASKPNNDMPMRELGKTGIQVGEVGIGCGVFGDMDTAQSRAFMQVALDSGVNYIDIYDANPTVRGNIGYALQGRRDEMVIQGHIGAYWNKDINKYERTRDVEKCKEGFEELLRLLGTDHIEVGMIHIVDNPAEWDSIESSPYMDYIKQLKAEGKIKHIGLSSHNAEAAYKAVKSGIVEVLMFSLNPAFDRLPADANPWEPESYDRMSAGVDPVRVALYDYCAQNGIGIVAMKAFGSGGGRLLSVEKSPIKVALTPSQCLAYALAKPCVSTVVCGANSIEELQSDLHYIRATAEEKDYESVLNTTAASTADHQCTYCNHCSPCPVGIDIAKVNKLLDKVPADGKVPADVQKEYDALEHHAGECVKCGGCQSRCPFEVPVIERMEQAVKVFGK